MPESPSNKRLIAFPHAGGTASVFSGLARQLAPAIELLSVQYPGRQERRREVLPTSLRALAAQLYPDIAMCADRPLTLFGHSMGAIVAFEVARLLQSSGVPKLDMLIASGSRSPSSRCVETLHTQSDENILDELRSLGGIHEELLSEPELRRLIPVVTREDYRLIETYAIAGKDKLTCPIVVLTGVDDPRTTVAEARAWQNHTLDWCKVEQFKGGHFFLIEDNERVSNYIKSSINALPN